MTEPLRLLIICLGNICRSPMAEGALRARLQASRPTRKILVDSAGTGGWHVGEPADLRTIATAARHGVDISDLRARQLCPADYTRFDWLLCADRNNLRDVLAAAPAGADARAHLLLPWAGVAGDSEIPDPYTGAVADFERVWHLVDAAATAIVARHGLVGVD